MSAAEQLARSGFILQRLNFHSQRVLHKFILSLWHIRYRFLHLKYRDYTMIGNTTFADNLVLVREHGRPVEGLVVECGVWRGGTSAAISEVMGADRTYYLFDSFEGLPPAQAEKDGAAAIAYQQDKESPEYHDNCAAEASYAESAMRLAQARNYHLVKGWFSDTLPKFKPKEPIAILRLDGDWYDSIMVCLQELYPSVAPGGLVILDDYYAWEGCVRAVHDFFSSQRLAERIRCTPNGVAYFIKSGTCILPQAEDAQSG